MHGGVLCFFNWHKWCHTVLTFGACFSLNLVFLRLVQADTYCRGAVQVSGESQIFRLTSWPMTSDASLRFKVPRASLTLTTCCKSQDLLPFDNWLEHLIELRQALYLQLQFYCSKGIRMRTSERERGKVWEGPHGKRPAVFAPGGSVQVPSPALTYNDAPEYSQGGWSLSPSVQSSLSPDHTICTADFSFSPSWRLRLTLSASSPPVLGADSMHPTGPTMHHAMRLSGGQRSSK